LERKNFGEKKKLWIKDFRRKENQTLERKAAFPDVPKVLEQVHRYI
jgi:hypothetical protein